MQLGLCSIARRQDPLDTVCAEAAALGFTGLEVWGKPPHIPELTAAAGSAARDAVLAAGLTPAVFGSYLRPGGDTFAAELDGVLAAATAYGAPLLRVWAGPVADDRADEALWARTLADFRTLLDQCGELVLSIERHPHTLTESLAGTVRLLDELPDPRLTINFQYAEGCDTAATVREIRRLWPRITNVHAQSFRKGRAWSLAGGELDYGVLLGTLRALGYQGFVEVEFVWVEGREGEASPAVWSAALAADYRYLTDCLAG